MIPPGSCVRLSDGRLGYVQWTTKVLGQGNYLVKTEEGISEIHFSTLTPVKADTRKYARIEGRMSVECIKNSLTQGQLDPEAFGCHRCGKNDPDERYSAIKGDDLRYECPDCLLLSAAEHDVQDLRPYADDRYLEAFEACLVATKLKKGSSIPLYEWHEAQQGWVLS